MNELQPVEVFDKLLSNFSRDEELAQKLYSPNLQDDFETKMAVVGFSYKSKTEKWGFGHFQFLKTKIRQSPIHDDDLPSDQVALVRAFESVCYGYLLGLFEERMINEQEFSDFERQLVGFLFLKMPELLRTQNPPPSAEFE